MPLPGDRRHLLERVLRATAVVAAALLIVRALTSRDAAGAGVVGSDALDSALVRWTLAAPGEAHLRADVVPPATARDWLVALRRTGTAVSWALRDTATAALVVEPVVGPRAAPRIVVVGAPGRSVVIDDAAGTMDSIVIGDAGALALRRSITGEVEARIGALRARSARRDSLIIRPVLVVGRAGWESKFVVAALEEGGWEVRARLSVAPGAVVQQGGAVQLDTAALSAVVVLDSASVPSTSALQRFVSQGGGLVAAGSAVAARSLASLLPARASGRVAGVPGALTGPAPRTGLTARTLAPSSPRAVVLDRRGTAPIVMAHRFGAGRAVVVGYEDSWRWRMLGGDNAPDAHRAWWNTIVSSVAHAPVVPMPATVEAAERPTAADSQAAVGLLVADRGARALDEAPLAAAVAALGVPQTDNDAPSPRRGSWLSAVLFALLLAGLLGEWGSRRLRGLP
ncbi:MAG TPA: hypothetical protein VF178_08280 [Gemmatimonadaceae bacterium]